VLKLGPPASIRRKGILTISLDLELIWGALDLDGPGRFRKACEIERSVVIDRLLDLLVEFDISATWCVLGHLFLDRCQAEDGLKHPEIIRPSHSWYRYDWFRHDPGGDERSEPLFFGRSLVEKIKSCPVPQEIGCHSFSHVVFGDSGCSREAAESEIAECVRLGRQMGIELRSFAFPRNQVGHLDVLADYGFNCYRGPDPTWYDKPGIPGPLKRLAHLLDVFAAARPPLVDCEPAEFGLWNIPGSMIYFPSHGIRRFVPMSRRVKRAVKGLNAAARQGRIFHLWFHPTNLADQTEKMFGGLRSILRHAEALREQGRLEILPMCAIAPAQEKALPVARAAGVR